MIRQKEQGDYRQKNKRRDRKGESNNSPEILDRGVKLDIPGLPSGNKKNSTKIHFHKFPTTHVQACCFYHTQI